MGQSSPPNQEDTIFEKMAKHLGVRYLYREMLENQALDPPAISISSASLSTATLTALPTDWLLQLQQATNRLDWSLMIELIEENRTIDAVVAENLANWVNNFEYDKISAFIQQATKRLDE